MSKSVYIIKKVKTANPIDSKHFICYHIGWGDTMYNKRMSDEDDFTRGPNESHHEEER